MSRKPALWSSLRIWPLCLSVIKGWVILRGLMTPFIYRDYMRKCLPNPYSTVYRSHTLDISMGCLHWIDYIVRGMFVVWINYMVHGGMCTDGWTQWNSSPFNTSRLHYKNSTRNIMTILTSRGAVKQFSNLRVTLEGKLFLGSMEM